MDDELELLLDLSDGSRKDLVLVKDTALECIKTEISHHYQQPQIQLCCSSGSDWSPTPKRHSIVKSSGYGGRNDPSTIAKPRSSKDTSDIEVDWSPRQKRQSKAASSSKRKDSSIAKSGSSTKKDTSDSDIDWSPRPKRPVMQSEEPIDLTVDSDSDFGVAVPQERESLDEWRMIREQQDREYEESLAIDREKVENARKARLLRELRGQLLLKDFTAGQVAGGTSVSFRLKCGKIDHTFPSTSSVKDLYQFVLLKGEMEEPFTVYRMLPRMPIPFSHSCLQSSGIGGNLLTVESDRSADFFSFFGDLGDAVVDEPDEGKGSGVKDAIHWSSIIIEADESRKAFRSSICKGKLSLKGRQFVGTGRININRSTIYKDAIEAYEKKPDLANHFDTLVTFDGEEAMDFGGVSRDFFSGFWEGAYVEIFDGAALLTPACHADVNVEHFQILGRILSHGYLSCGFMPTRVSFPVLAFALLGLSTSISQEMLVNAFSEFLSLLDYKTIALALNTDSEFSVDMKAKLISILSRFGCRDVPTCLNLKHLLFSLAKHQFRSQPFAALCAMNAGIPDEHRPFWEAISVERLYSVFSALAANPEKVLEKVLEPDFANPNEERVFGYLQQYIGEMKVDESKRFLRFVTGSSVLTSSSIRVDFNALTGFARRPTTHTCSNLLILPHTYNTFLEFVEEFSAVLSNELCWCMNSL